MNDNQLVSPLARSKDFIGRVLDSKIDGKRLAEFLVSGTYNFFPLYTAGTIFRLSDGEETKNKISKPQGTFIRRVGMRLLMVLISIGAYIRLLIARPRVLIFSVDKMSGISGNDARLDTVYRALKKKNISFIELLHTFPDGDFFRNFKNRDHLVLYSRVIDFIFLFFRARKNDFSSLDGDFKDDNERKTALHLVHTYREEISRSEMRIKLLTLFLSLSSVECVFTIDDPRNYGELLVACERLKIPVYAVQHGFFSKYHIGWLRNSNDIGRVPTPTKLLVWSEYWKQELLRLGTYFKDEQIEVGGSLVKDNNVVYGNNVHKDATLGVLFLYENLMVVKKDVKKYMDVCLADSACQVYFKLRPGKTADEQFGEYGLRKEDIKKIIPVTDIQSVVSSINIVAGTYSSFLYDMIVYEKPVAILKSIVDMGDGMIENGLADLVSFEEGDVLLQMKKLSNTSQEILRKRKDKIGTLLSMEDTIAKIIEKEKLA